MATKTILVIGATGKQGSSVAEALLEDRTFQVRCMIRGIKDTNIVQLDNLIKQGAQLVYGDLENVESLVNAMDGCYGVFAVTNFWDPKVGYEGEISQGRYLAKAAKKAGIQHMVYSTLDQNSDVPHFESKVSAERYITRAVPTTSLVTSFYYENFETYFKPKEEDGVLVFAVAQKPETKVPMYSVSQTGKWVLEAFLHPEEHINKDISAVGEYISYPKLVETFEKVTGKKARFQEIPNEVFAKSGFPGAEELAANLRFFDEIHLTKTINYATYRCSDKQDRRHAESKGESWEEFLRRTGWSG